MKPLYNASGAGLSGRPALAGVCMRRFACLAKSWPGSQSLRAATSDWGLFLEELDLSLNNVSPCRRMSEADAQVAPLRLNVDSHVIARLAGGFQVQLRRAVVHNLRHFDFDQIESDVRRKHGTRHF